MPQGAMALGRMHGRDAELAQAVDALAGTGRRGRSLLVVEGPPGIGKTRLLRELADTARRRHSLVFERQGWMPPIAVARLRTECEQLATRVTPASAGRTGPILVAWDDPPWSDPGLLPALWMTPPALPILWALTRPVDGPVLSGVAGITTVELGCLPGSGVCGLVADLVGAPPPADLLALAAVAAGNPGAVVDLVEGLREEGLLRVRGGAGSGAGTAGAHLVADRLPKRTLAGIGRSLGRLSVDARHLVQVAAALGLRSRPRDLAGLLNTTVAQILPAVADALTHGLLNSDGEGLAFCHDLVRRAVADTVPASVRRALAEDADRIAQATPPPAAAAPGRMPPVQRHATPWDALAGPPSREPPSIPLRDSRGPVSSTAWASLTATEQLVAVLIGRALTNRQVATRLRVSPHTVNYHLRQIYRKLDINSRVHLARLVYDHLPEPPAAA